MAVVVSAGQLAGLDRPPTVASTGRIVLASDFAQDYAEIWRTQPQVRTVIGFLGRNIAQIGLHTFERVSDTDRRRLTDHPLARLFAKPTPRTTRYRLFDALVNDLGIYDVAFWAKLGTAGVTQGLLRLPPAHMSPVGGTWDAPGSFRFRGNRGSVDLAVDSVVFFRGYNPADSRWGVSPMETLRRILAEEYEAGRYREQLWRNGARFSGVIQRPAGVAWTDQQRERFRSDWRGLYTGNGPAAGGTPVLEDGMTFAAGGITPEQAQYLQTRKLTREEVAAAFHIPLPMVGILDNATFSNITEQHKQLYQDTLGPWLTMIQEEIGLQLVPDFDTSGKVYVEFNLAEKLKGSFEEQAAQLQTAVGAPWLTRNEARARQNLPQVDGGDTLVTPLNVLVGGQASPTDSAPPKAGSRVRVKARAAESFEQKHVEVVGRFFRRQAAAVRSQLGAKAADEWWDGARWDRELAGDLYALAVSTSKSVAASVLDGIGYSPDKYDVDRTLAFLKAVADRVAGQVNAVTKAQLDAALQEDDPTAAVANVFDVATGSRTAQVAVTAVTAWSGFAAVESAKQVAGQAATKTWITGRNPRPSHAAMSGETVALSENFSNGLAWPGDAGDADEVAGCNCELEINIP